jgi:hypothetical protein
MARTGVVEKAALESAFQLIVESVPADLFWTFGKGVCGATEPLFGLAIYRTDFGFPDKDEDILASGENDCPIEAVREALHELAEPNG